MSMMGAPEGFLIKDMAGLRHNLAIKERKILIYDDVDENSILECMYYLYRFRSIDESVGTKRPIDILINTSGGSVMDGLSLISLIESMKDEGWVINTYNIGYCFSMGFLISIVGTNRYTYRYSTYLYHDVSTQMEGKAASIDERMEEVHRLREIGTDIVTKYTNLTKEDIENIYNKKLDKVYTPQQAIALHIADKIV